MIRNIGHAVLFFIYIGYMLSLAVAVSAAFLIYDLSTEEASLEKVRNYLPPITTRVHASDGSLLHEFALENRVYVTLDRIPVQLQHAFLAAEDQRFYQHSGIDLRAIFRAAIANIALLRDNKRPIGASTITQQVAKNFLLSNELSLERKIREAIIALRIENILTKDKILELYLNRIYLGLGQYGVASAALNYFDASLDELTIAEMAYLAALPKAPSNYHPVNQRENALARRNWVLSRMLLGNYINQETYDKALASDLVVTHRILNRGERPNYFIEEIRRFVSGRFPANAIHEQGYSIRTTLEPRLQEAAEKSLRAGLVLYDRRHGWRKAQDQIESESLGSDSWLKALDRKAETISIRSASPWKLAVVLKTDDKTAIVGLRDGSRHPLFLDQNLWTRPVNSPIETVPLSMRQIVSPGDIIFVNCQEANQDQSCTIEQMPEIDGALVAMNPHTGRVHAMVGGWSFYRSEFNRVTQALRQPGSAFKPFVYLAALEQGYAPSARILDAPLLFDSGPLGLRWRPENYSRVFYGPTTMRTGVERSRNLMTIRLALTTGMTPIVEVARRFGLNDNLLPNYASALGTGETTLMRLTTAYAMLVNGGILITPRVIDYIQDRTGKTIYSSDKRVCANCAEPWVNDGQRPPQLIETRYSVTAPDTAYQIVSMLEGVIDRGTGWRLRSVPFPLAGKTGTSDDSIDAWFIGFSPDLAVGVFVGHDVPRSLADDVYENETGSSVAIPIWKMFIEEALEGQAPTPFRVPDGVTFINIDRTTGKLAQRVDENSLLEVFKASDELPGQEASQLITGVRRQSSQEREKQRVQPTPQNGNAPSGIY